MMRLTQQHWRPQPRSDANLGVSQRLVGWIGHESVVGLNPKCAGIQSLFAGPYAHSREHKNEAGENPLSSVSKKLYCALMKQALSRYYWTRRVFIVCKVFRSKKYPWLGKAWDSSGRNLTQYIKTLGSSITKTLHRDSVHAYYSMHTRLAATNGNCGSSAEI